MKEMKINCMEKLFDEIKFRSGWGFRGQASCNWPLTSGIDRTINNIRDNNRLLTGQHQNIFLEMRSISELLNLNQEQLEKFGLNIQNDDNFLLIQVLLQHYGYKTRLIDWTKNWKIALYFCLEDNSQTDDMVLWCINYKKIPPVNTPISDENYLFPTILFEDSKMYSFCFRLKEGVYLIDEPFFHRIQKQEGFLLTTGHTEYMTFEEQVLNSPWLNKDDVILYQISNNLRNDIKMFLHENNIDKKKLYPKDDLNIQPSQLNLLNFANSIYPQNSI